MNNLDKTHEWLMQFKDDHACVIDMTCGNGHDTLFLAQHFKRVLAVDIQKEALERTQALCQDHKNIDYQHMNHADIDFACYQPILGAIYNLGYLPKGDKSIITQAKSTAISLEKLLPYLKAFLVITTYRRHPGGLEEHEAVMNFINKHKLPYTSLTYDKPLSPYTLLIDLRP